MSVKLSRRDALKYASFSALALSHAKLFSACSGPAEPELEALTLDPSMPWWMQGPFAPVQEEHEFLQLEVTGKIPQALEGTYVRNGPNPKRDRGSWFVGDGMLHGVRLQGGRALWYRNRFVQTPILDRDPSVMSNPVLRPTDTASNVNLVHHGGKLLSLGEAGLPFEVAAADLSTIGPYDFAGRLKTFMTAHPKIDPRTGDMHMFGYGFGTPYLTYHRVSASGELVRSEPIVLPRSVMMHDFAITESQIVFMDLPVVFDLAQAAAGVSFPFHWDATNGARIGLMPHGGGNADVIWFEIEPCFVFHPMNAYDDATGKVVLEVCRYPHLFLEGTKKVDADPFLYRYTLDPSAGTAQVEQLDDRGLEFPRTDPRLIGRAYRYGYGLWLDTFDFSAPPRSWGLLKYDRERDSTAVHEFPSDQIPGEPLFVPARADADEDEGFILSFVLDRRTDRSSLDIFDARDLTRRAVASVKVPSRVPIGLHGLWIPG